MNKSKKYIILAIVLILIIIIGTIFIISLITKSKDVALLYIEGGEVSFDSGNGWQPAKDEMGLKENYKIKTSENSQALILLHNENILRMEENTEIILQEISDEKISMKQESGSIWNRILMLTGNQVYEVNTPNTVASVRGTGFLVDLTEEEKIIVGEGVVNVKSRATRESKDVFENKKVVVLDGIIEEKSLEIEELEKISNNLEKDISILKRDLGILERLLQELIPRNLEELAKEFEPKDEETERGSYFQDIGKFFGCENIPEVDERDGCYSMLAISTQDINVCQNIQSQSEREGCYLALASMISDPEICSEISGEIEEDDCYGVIAITTQDADICKRIIDKQEREGCYMSLAFTTQNIELCKKIEDAEKRNNCESFFILAS